MTSEEMLREIEGQLARIENGPWVLKNDLDGDAEAFLVRSGPWLLRQLREAREENERFREALGAIRKDREVIVDCGPEMPCYASAVAICEIVDEALGESHD